MAKLRFRTGERRDIFLYRTQVENLFINEFLPDAPGEYVKVFLFGLMYAQYDQEIDPGKMARILGLTEKDVDNAWKYWESRDLVRLAEGGTSGEEGAYSVEFIRQIDSFYGKTIEDTYPVGETASPAEEQAPSSEEDAEAREEAEADAIIDRLVNRQLRELFGKYQDATGRTISRVEAGRLTDAVRLYNIEPDVLDFAIDYCTELDKYSVEYICKVALRWTEEGARDVAAVKRMIDSRSKRNDAYRKVFTELGFSRLPNPSDREIMDRWFDELGCTLADVLDACRAAGGMREPHLRYVNKVIENRLAEKGGVNTRAEAPARQGSQESSQGSAQTSAAKPGAAMVSRKVLREYYDWMRAEDERLRRARTEEAEERIPELKAVFAEEAGINSEVIALKPGAAARERRQRLRAKRQELAERRGMLLEAGGYPADWLDRKYRCGICRDTGYTDEGRVCTCARERAEEAYRWIQQTGNRQ